MHARAFDFRVETIELPFGGIAIDTVGQPFPQETVNACLKADAVLLGAVGGVKWDSLPLSQRPEAGLLALRRTLAVYANIRPIRLSEPLRSLSPLRLGPNTVVNFEIIRELVGDIYFGKHTNEGSGAEERASDLATYSVPEIERITRVAFERAKRRSKRVASVRIRRMFWRRRRYGGKRSRGWRLRRRRNWRSSICTSTMLRCRSSCGRNNSMCC